MLSRHLTLLSLVACIVVGVCSRGQTDRQATPSDRLAADKPREAYVTLVTTPTYVIGEFSSSSLLLSSSSSSLPPSLAPLLPLPSCPLPTYLPTFLPSYLPTYLPSSYLPSFLLPSHSASSPMSFVTVLSFLVMSTAQVLKFLQSVFDMLEQLETS
eukprot:762875-Hanusia_phi.AAC.8